MKRSLFCLLMVACLAAAAAALEPDEVLVVVNKHTQGSEELGKYYCLARGIPDGRTVVLNTTTGYAATRNEYDKEVAAPIRDYLVRSKLQDKIKCVVLMWGVPVRVIGHELTAAETELGSVYKSLAGKADARMAVDLALLKTVALSFPQPKSESLEPLMGLFNAPPADTGDKPPTAFVNNPPFEAELKKRQAAAEQLTDPAKKQIAMRQLAAIRRDVYGLAGLLEALPQFKGVSGVPAKEELAKQIADLQKELDELAKSDKPEDPRKAGDVKLRLDGVLGLAEMTLEKSALYATGEEDAAVDSELSLLWEEKPAKLAGPRPNALNWRFQYTKQNVPDLPTCKMLMAARIDGPSAKDALRIIKDSVAVENDKEKGLSGKLYVDAGGLYKPYDPLLVALAESVKRNTSIPVVLDESPELFKPGTCPDAALYVGWYSLRKYVPAFTWSRGAVGWHIASFEAAELRDPKSETWCVKMIQNGVTATIGPVNEPFLSAFPLPQEFFGLLLTGKYTVAECYWRTIPNASWRMTLIADPLYNPFKLHPQLKVTDLPGQWTGLAPTSAPATGKSQ